MRLREARIWMLPILLLLQAPVLAFQGIPTEVPEELLREAENSYIFVFTDNVSPGEVRGLARGLAAAEGGSVRRVFTKALRGFSANVSEAGAARIARSPRVAYYEPNAIVWAFYSGLPDSELIQDPEQPGYQAQGNGPGSIRLDTEQPAQVLPWGVARIGGPRDGSGRHAWVIDTGIDLDHPDLNVGSGADLVDGDASPNDEHGHGTHVAGTIGAIDNDIAVVGVAANATVHPVRVLDRRGFGTTDWIVAGIDYVALNAVPGDMANMSLGGLGHQDSIHDAVLNAADLGIRFSIAAGNDSDDANNYEPADVEHANVYTISAVDSLDVFASFSNYGNPPVDFAAPGVDILSTEAGGTVTTKSGTSMAAPHVGGILLFQTPVADGYAIDDPDGTPDPIAHF